MRLKEKFSKDPEDDICYLSVHGLRCLFMRRMYYSRVVESHTREGGYVADDLLRKWERVS